jgi:hypothetical protein
LCIFSLPVLILIILVCVCVCVYVCVIKPVQQAWETFSIFLFLLSIRKVVFKWIG